MKETNPEKLKTWRQISYQRAKTTIKAKIRRKKQRLVRMFGGCCSKCGYSKNLAALDFHHPDDKTKASNVGLLLPGSFNKAFFEAKKCVLLCSNCHREETYPDLLNTEHLEIT